MFKRSLFLVSLFASVFSSETLLWAEPVTAPHVEVQLISEQESFSWGKPFRVAVQWNIEEGWHLYWKNPGDSGEPPKVEWKLPAGFSVKKSYWPTPKAIALPPLRNYGYETELVLVSEIQPPTSGSALSAAAISADVSWLVCQQSCIPGQANLSLELPAAEQSSPGQYAELFVRTQTTWPSPQSPWAFEVKVEDGQVELAGKGRADFEDAYFFAEDRALFRHAEDQPLQKTADGWTLKLPKRNTFPPKLEHLAGVLVVEGKQREAFDIDIILGAAASASWQESLWAILAAFLGGLILNLMPCVFPILCLKVLSFASLGGKGRKKAFASSVAYALGVLFSFWSLAIALLVLRAGGEQLGWGFQLQSPYFLIGLICLLLALSLNFFGVYEIGGSWTGAGQGLAGKEGLAGSFFSGVLATLVATPCTAPFMGTAVGFAFAQPAYITLIIFSALALGLAAPYVLLALSPGLVSRMPRPGHWMVTLKQGMGFLLLLTVLWLLTVLALQVQLTSVFHVLGAMLVLSFGLWLWGVGGNIARVVAAIICIFSLYWGFHQGVYKRAADAQGTSERWEKYSEEGVEKAVREGQAVFVDFTAAWCITCQVNEQVALEVDSVRQKFEEKKVRLFKADWTNQDAQIAKKLESFSRQGVPLYVFYPGNNQAARILPQILTPQIVLDELEKSTVSLPSNE